MADNYLERNREDYELRKKKWLLKKKRIKVHKQILCEHKLERPEDESL